MLDRHLERPRGFALLIGAQFVSALADNARQAQHRAYELLKGVSFDGMQYRADIGHRAIRS